MDIVVCVQQVLDPGVSLRVDEDTGVVAQLEPEPVYILNPADRSALEAAMCLAQTKPGARVTALTLGPSGDAVALRYCLARGAQSAVRIWDEALAGADPTLTARVLAKAIRLLAPALVICGGRSVAGSSGQVPATLAELLGLPQLTSVVAMELTNRGLVVQRRLERGNRLVLECPLPALAAVEANSFAGRYVSWRAQMRAQQPVRELGLTDLGLTPADVASDRYLVHTTKVTPPRPRTKKTAAPVAAGGDMLAMLIGSGAPAKQQGSGGIRAGAPDNLAAEAVKFLQEKGLLPTSSG